MSLLIRRVLAMLIDLSLAALAVPACAAVSRRLVLHVVEYFALESTVGDGLTSDLASGCSIALVIAASVGFLGWFLGSSLFLATSIAIGGATPGKYLAGIEVQRSRGGRPGILRALSRETAKGLSGALLGIGFLMPLWTRRRQALHDFIARCVVVPVERSRRRLLVAAPLVAVLLGVELPVVVESVSSVVRPVQQAFERLRSPGPIEQLGWAMVKRGWEDFERARNVPPAPDHGETPDHRNDQ